MAKQTINIGSSADDGTGTTVRAGGDLINDNFNEIYTELGNGSALAIASKTQTLTNASGNLLVASATNITEFRGDGSSVEGQIKLNCHANSHGQTIKPQPHSASITNTMLLPQGGNSTLVSEIATQTLTNKTIGVGQVTGNTRNATGDGSTVAFTVTNGMTVNNTLVFINGVFQRPTTDYSVSGTTLTFGTAPVAADVITIKEL